MSQGTEFKTTKEEKAIEKQLHASIRLAVELESTFKLYGYRMINPEQFINITKEHVDRFRAECK